MLDSQIDEIVRLYAGQARSTIQALQRRREGEFDLNEVAVLETGCGIGYAVMAMARLGVGDAVGIDSGAVDSRHAHEKAAISERLGMSAGALEGRVRILAGDITAMPLDDDAFDAIYSASVLEHIFDLPAAFMEMARVLRPGGFMFHNFDPFFSPQGGHALCTLDFPWGHARLNRDEFCRYVDEFRPHEAPYAADFYEHGFNRPRIAFHEIEQAIAAAGLSILSWREYWRPDHLPSSGVWREVNRHHPTASTRDLSVDGLYMVLTKM